MRSLLLLALTTAWTITLSAQTVQTPAPGTGIIFENRTDIPNAPNCNPSEVYLKKKVKSLLAKFYKEYPQIAVDITSFKGQNGYSDEKDTGRIVYPYKIEVLVYLKRKVMKEGKEYTEYSTWEHDSVYEYATKPGKKCEFYLVPSSDSKLISRELY